jgi:hypothetical protein
MSSTGLSHRTHALALVLALAGLALVGLFVRTLLELITFTPEGEAGASTAKHLAWAWFALFGATALAVHALARARPDTWLFRSRWPAVAVWWGTLLLGALILRTVVFA